MPDKPTALLLEPHQDDAALFAAFTCYAVRPLVVTVLRSMVQEQRGTGITAAGREAENERAMKILGCSWKQWPYRDDAPDWTGFADDLRTCYAWCDTVYAPAVEDDGHDHHNWVGELAGRVFGDRARFYLTYTRHGGKSTWGEQVTPADGAVSAKLRALACYGSQADLPDCRPHFLRGLDEYLAPQ